MSKSKYTIGLDKSSKKYICPQCKKKRLVIYLSHEKKVISHNVGRCDRSENCQYHYTPKEFYSKHPKPNFSSWKPEEKVISKPINYIPTHHLERSLSNYDKNYFVCWLESLFDSNITAKLVDLFNIGTAFCFPGAVVFWQIDLQENIRQSKAMPYDKKTGKRIKKKYWADCFFMGKKILKNEGIEDPNLKQCLFGLHQLKKDKDKPVAIVESEKTAIVMTAFSWLGMAPNVLWIATGGKNGVKWNESLTWLDLRNRKIILYPDVGAYAEWKKKSYLISTSNVLVSDYLELNATSEHKGLDVADFYIKHYTTSIKVNQKAQTTYPVR